MKIQVYIDKANELRWRGQAQGNSEVLGDGGQGYSDLDDLIHGMCLFLGGRFNHSPLGGVLLRWEDVTAEDGPRTLSVVEHQVQLVDPDDETRGVPAAVIVSELRQRRRDARERRQ